VTKLADHAPSHCAACFQQDSTLRHIDFEAAYDGPVIPGTPEPVPVDDLILCENCLATAFDLLDPQGLHEEIARVTAQVEGLRKDLDAKDRIISNLRHTTDELVDHPIKPPRGQPKIGVSDPQKSREIKAARHARRKAKA